MKDSLNKNDLSGVTEKAIEDWLAKERKVNMTLEVSTNHSALITGVTFGGIERGYTAGEVRMQSMVFSANEVDWTET